MYPFFTTIWVFYLIDWLLVYPKPVHNVETIHDHYANMSMQYTAIFHGCKNVNFLMKNYNIFLFWSKHRLWVHVRTATVRRF